MRLCLSLIFTLLCGSAGAFDLAIVNHTGASARIVRLISACGQILVSEEKPILLKEDETYIIKNAVPVMHHYTACGSGRCDSSSVGIKDADTYTLELVLKDGVIDGQAQPDHWVGNTKCPTPSK